MSNFEKKIPTYFFVGGSVGFFSREAFPEETPSASEVQGTRFKLGQNVLVGVGVHGILQKRRKHNC